MKIYEILNEEHSTDPDFDKLPNIVLQVRKSLDTGGNRPLSFRDGTTKTVPVNAMVAFMNKYETLKPIDREKMQKQAIESFGSFMDVVKSFVGQRAPKSIY